MVCVEGGFALRAYRTLGIEWVCDAPTGACVCASEHCGRGAPPYVSPPLVDPEAWGLLLKATALIALSAFGSYTGSALTEAARRVVQYR